MKMAQLIEDLFRRYWFHFLSIAVLVAACVSAATVPPRTAPATHSSRQIEISYALTRAKRAAAQIDDESDRIEVLARVAAILARTDNRHSANALFATLVERVIDPNDSMAESAHRFPDEIREWAEPIVEASSRSIALREIASAQAQIGYIDAAMRTARSIRSPSLRSVDRHDQVGNFTAFWTGLEGAQAIGDVATSLADLGNFDAAFKTATSIEDSSFRSLTLAQLAVIQCNSGDAQGAGLTFNQAATVARSVSSRSLRVSALAMVATLQVSVQRSGDARVLLDEAFRIARSESKEVYRSSALESVMDARAECGDVEGVRRIAAEIRSCSRYPDEWRFQRAIAIAQSQAGDFLDASETAMGIDDKHSHDYALWRLVQAQVKVDRIEGAHRVAASMWDKFWIMRGLMEIASAEVAAGNEAEVHKVLQEVRKVASTIRDTRSHRTWIFREIGSMHVEVGMVDEVVDWAETLPTPQARAGAFLGVAEALVEHAR